MRQGCPTSRLKAGLGHALAAAAQRGVRRTRKAVARLIDHYRWVRFSNRRCRYDSTCSTSCSYLFAPGKLCCPLRRRRSRPGDRVPMRGRAADGLVRKWCPQCSAGVRRRQGQAHCARRLRRPLTPPPTRGARHLSPESWSFPARMATADPCLGASPNPQPGARRRPQAHDRQGREGRLRPEGELVRGRRRSPAPHAQRSFRHAIRRIRWVDFASCLDAGSAEFSKTTVSEKSDAAAVTSSCNDAQPTVRAPFPCLTPAKSRSPPCSRSSARADSRDQSSRRLIQRSR
jgi:hypothetical protein